MSKTYLEGWCVRAGSAETSKRGDNLGPFPHFPSKSPRPERRKDWTRKVTQIGAQAPAALALPSRVITLEKPPGSSAWGPALHGRESPAFPSKCRPHLQVLKHQEAKGVAQTSASKKLLECQDLVKGIRTHGALCTRCPRPSETDRRHSQTKVFWFPETLLYSAEGCFLVGLLHVCVSLLLINTSLQLLK